MDVDLNLSLSKRGGSNRKRKKKKVTNDNTIWHTWSACVCLCVLSRDKTSGRGGGYGKARERKRSCHFWAGHMWLLTTRSLSFFFLLPLALSFSFCDGPFSSSSWKTSWVSRVKAAPTRKHIVTWGGKRQADKQTNSMACTHVTLYPPPHKRTRKRITNHNEAGRPE